MVPPSPAPARQCGTVRTRSGGRPPPCLLIASPVLAPAPAAPRTTSGRPRRRSSTPGPPATPAPRRRPTTDADARRPRCWSRRPTDLPGAALRRRSATVDVKDEQATVAWTATWDLAAAPDWSYAATLRLRKAGEDWQVVAAAHGRAPGAGGGAAPRARRSLPDRAAITDADGAPLFTPTEVVNVGVDTAKVTDLPALAAGLSAATGVSADKIVADVQAAPAGQFVPVITLRRPDFEKIRAQVFDLPGRGLPDRDPAAGARRRASPSRCSAGSARPPPRCSRSPRTTARPATPPATSWASPGCSAPSRSSSPAPPASRSPSSAPTGTGDEGRQIAVGRPGSRHAAADAARPGRAERRRRRRGHPEAADPPRRGPPGHRRDPRRVLQRRRPTPATPSPASSRPARA